MYQRVCKYIESFSMICKGESILVGVSGGPDSVCLLDILYRLSRDYELSLYVLHVDHMIRKEAAREDSRFVKNLCEGYGLPFMEVQEDVAALAEHAHISIEEAGRNVRYQAFDEWAVKWGCTRIAVAHHRTDQAETVLFRLFRGSGLRGLCGMQPVREKIIRPLLCVEQGEIMQYLKENNLSYRIDSSNEEDAYSRNMIRHHILPYAEKINPAAIRHIAETAGHLGKVEAYVARQAALAYEQIKEKDALLLEPFGKLDIFLQEEVVRRFYQEAAGSLKDVDRRHIEAVLKLCTMENGKEISLPQGLVAVKQYNRIRIFKAAGEDETLSVQLYYGKETVFHFTDEENHTVTLRITWITDVEEVERCKRYFLQTDGTQEKREGECVTQTDGAKLLTDTEYMEYKGKNSCTKCLDCGKIIDTLFLRYPQEGDFMQIDKEGHKKKLSRIWIDEKLPARKRLCTAVIAGGNHILWVPGRERISEACKITKETTQIMLCNYAKD